MKQLVGRGLTVRDAAAVTANAMGESGGWTGAKNASGAGGLFQWLSRDRRSAFLKREGANPEQSSLQQQLDFLLHDPKELHLLRLSLNRGGSAQEAGERVSRIFEAHGNTAEDARRGKVAAQLERQYAGSGGQGAGDQAGTQYNLNGPITIQANNPQELAGGLQRVSGVQNYNSSVR